MADNSAALRRARRHDSHLKRQQAADALAALEQSGEAVSFPAVARRASVSVSLLYADPELASRIATIRDRQRQAGPPRAWQLPAHSLVTEQSRRACSLALARSARRLSGEVSVLRDRLARQLGADADIARGRAMSPVLDQLEQRAAGLEADNHRLRRRITQLEGDMHELTDTLDAARAMNRELIGELNRDERSPTTPTGQRPTRLRP